LKLNDMLAYKSSRLANMLSASLADAYKDMGITVPQWRILATLGELGELTAKAIALHTHLDKVTVSRAVTLLSEKKLIKRTVSKKDARAVDISLSHEGSTVYKTLIEIVEAWQADTLAKLNGNISDNEYAVFLKVMDALISQKSTIIE
jgi:DNA-binding MarR family transcriptional regulator